MHGKRTIVDRNTGYLQDREERNCSLSGNHISICKFPADEEGKSGFQTVGTNLRWLATGTSRAKRMLCFKLSPEILVWA
jgi:hypothetical protein